MSQAPLIEQMAVAYATQIEEQQAEIERLRAENTKLRAALERQLLDRYTYDEVLSIARAALNEKTE